MHISKHKLLMTNANYDLAYKLIIYINTGNTTEKKGQRKKEGGGEKIISENLTHFIVRT